MFFLTKPAGLSTTGTWVLLKYGHFRNQLSMDSAGHSLSCPVQLLLCGEFSTLVYMRPWAFFPLTEIEQSKWMFLTFMNPLVIQITHTHYC